MIKRIGLAFLLIVPSEAWAGTPVPQYPVDQGCSYFGSTRTGPEIARNMCIVAEQDAYDYVNKVWPELPEEIRAKCAARVAAVPSDLAYTIPAYFLYDGLATCLASEEQLMLAQKPLSFKP